MGRTHYRDGFTHDPDSWEPILKCWTDFELSQRKPVDQRAGELPGVAIASSSITRVLSPGTW
jgi:hypothetical protein